MKLIAGLGNPGRQYEGTRHNVGFRVLDELAGRWGIAMSRHSFSGLMGNGTVGGQHVLLLKPQTYVNHSGQSVRQAMTFHKLPLSELLVITDDLALPLARIRLRPKGSAGGHKGLANIIVELGSEEFARIRIGIEWVSGEQMVGHVLSPFTPEEEKQIGPAVQRAADAAECWLSEGLQPAMGRYNRTDEPDD